MKLSNLRKKKSANAILPEQEIKKLMKAKETLENPGWAMRISHLIGITLEKGVEKLPEGVRNKIQKTTYRILEEMVKWASNPSLPLPDNPLIMRALVTISGIIGGIGGWDTLILELPVSTFLMLRNITSTARKYGEDILSPQVRLECISIFAMGSPHRPTDDAGEIGYYAVRMGLAEMVEKSAEYIITKGVSREGSPYLVKFMVTVAERLGIILTEKIALEVLPLIGGVSGAFVNNIFFNHFHKVADAHFYIKQMEKMYGKDAIKRVYKEL